MQTIRPFLAVALFALAACGDPDEIVVDMEVPAELRDLPYYAGIEGNDMVHHETLYLIVQQTIDARDFAALNNIGTYLRAKKSRLPGGTWELDSFHRGVGRALAYRPMDPSCVLRGVDFAQAWAEHDPTQPGPYITEAAMYLDYAWCLRGDDYAINVKPEAWQGFRANADKAYEVLSAHADIAKSDPHYYVVMERIALARGNRGPDYDDLLDEGADSEPYYTGIYMSAATNAMPKWGGSVADVDWVARYAVAETREKDGAGYYARVYWHVMDSVDDLKSYNIDRALLAQAMDDVWERYPSDWNAANFARMACRLGERDLTRRQFERGGREDGIEWDDSGEWRRCRQFAGLA